MPNSRDLTRIADWLGSDWRLVIDIAAVVGAAMCLGLCGQRVSLAIEEEKLVRSSTMVQTCKAAPHHQAVLQRSINEAKDEAILTNRMAYGETSHFPNSPEGREP